MIMYERYVDDSNQVAIVPPVGSVYDPDRQKVIVDPQVNDNNVPQDERLARILLCIANSIMPCIVMEADWPSKNSDQKMPILDMKVWVNAEGYIMYQHYEKTVTSKTVLHSQSAHSCFICPFILFLYSLFLRVY